MYFTAAWKDSIFNDKNEKWAEGFFFNETNAYDSYEYMPYVNDKFWYAY